MILIFRLIFFSWFSSHRRRRRRVKRLQSAVGWAMILRAQSRSALEMFGLEFGRAVKWVYESKLRSAIKRWFVATSPVNHCLHFPLFIFSNANCLSCDDPVRDEWVDERNWGYFDMLNATTVMIIRYQLSPFFAPQQSLIRKSHNPGHSSRVACAHTPSTFVVLQLHSAAVRFLCNRRLLLTGTKEPRACSIGGGRRRKAIRQLSMMTID